MKKKDEDTSEENAATRPRELDETSTSRVGFGVCAVSISAPTKAALKARVDVTENETLENGKYAGGFDATDSDVDGYGAGLARKQAAERKKEE